MEKVNCPKCKEKVFKLEVCLEAGGKIMCADCSDQVVYENWLKSPEVARDMPWLLKGPRKMKETLK